MNQCHRENPLATAIPATYLGIMSTIQQIEDAVRQLSEQDRVAFRTWYTEFDAEEWDRQLAADVAAGSLDWLVYEARRDNREGRCTDR